MPISTEQEVIDAFWPGDSDKTIEDLISVFITDFGHSRNNAISILKEFDDFLDVTDWSV